MNENFGYPWAVITHITVAIHLLQTVLIYYVPIHPYDRLVINDSHLSFYLYFIAPLTADLQPRQQIVDAGKSAVLNCVVSGHPLLSVSWYKDGVLLNPDERMKMTTRNSLEIREVQRKDIGMYQCFVENEEESVQGTAEVKLGGKK